MYTDHYFVDREMGTYSDACAAFGLAYLLSRALQDAGLTPQVTLKDCGTAYLLQLATPMTQEIVDKAQYRRNCFGLSKTNEHLTGRLIIHSRSTSVC